MAKLVRAPQRFTHQEWTESNLTKYANAEAHRAGAERLVEESKRLSDETEKRTEKTQRDVNKKFRKYSKTCHKRSLKKKNKIGFQDPLSLNAGQKYCRMLQESILQYCRPSLSYHLLLRPLFCLFLSCPFRQVLL